MGIVRDRMYCNCFKFSAKVMQSENSPKKMNKKWCLVMGCVNYLTFQQTTAKIFGKLGVLMYSSRYILLCDAKEYVQIPTDSIKINRLGITNVCTERFFDSQPFIYSKVFLKKTLIEVCSPYLWASFGTFCVQIGQSFEAQWVFEV